MLSKILNSLKIVAAALLLSGCSSLLYYPSTIEYVDKSKFHVKYDDSFFTDEFGNQIHYWYFHSPKPKGKILFFHGNAQNLTSHFAMLAWIVDYNYDFMIFDYPGYGQSSGTPTPETTTKSGAMAIDKIISIKPELPLFLYGQSLGGQILQKSINLRPQTDYKALFLEGSFLSYRSVARSVLAKHWLTWLFQPIGWLVMSDQWAGDPSLISPKPLYVIHGKKDSVVGFDQGLQIYQKAKEPKKFIPIDEGGHGNIYFIEKGIHRKKLLEILTSYTPQDY